MKANIALLTLALLLLPLSSAISITPESPSDDTLNATSVTLNASIQSLGDPANQNYTNITFYLWNATAQFRTNVTNLTGNGQQYPTTTFNGLTESTYKWFAILAYSNGTTSNWIRSGNATFIINYSYVPPSTVIAVQNYPSDGAEITTYDVTANYTIFADNANFTNITYYLYNTTTLVNTSVRTLSGTGGQYATLKYFNLKEDMTYKWSAVIRGRGNNGSLNLAYPTTNFTFTVNAIPYVAPASQYGTTYDVMASAGAGLGTFMDFMTDSAVPFLLVIGFVGGAVFIVWVIAKGIRQHIVRRG